MNALCQKHAGTNVIHSSSKPCPLCVALEQRERLIWLLVNKGVIPTPPPGHHWYILREELQMNGPDFGLCMTWRQALEVPDEEFLCDHEPFPHIPLPSLPSKTP